MPKSISGVGEGKNAVWKYQNASNIVHKDHDEIECHAETEHLASNMTLFGPIPGYGTCEKCLNLFHMSK